MEKNSFIFDTNKCVGCMACVAGCIIENGTSIPLNWRVVNGYNSLKHPDLPVFHFSLACNHCDDAPCMKNCPALAYTRDEITGAVIHHAEACIGCSYCTWACPYDAPKMNPATHLIEKCDFCTDRIKEGEKPACASACPVGALDFGKTELKQDDYLIPGFVDTGIRPSIKLIPLRSENTSPHIINTDAETINTNEINGLLPRKESKVSLKKEWALVLFTMIVAVLVSWFAASVTHQTKVSPAAFILLAFTAVGLSSFHIGKKNRMWRFILNLRSSWLSREIFSFSSFVGLAALSLFTKIPVFEYLAIFFGIACAVSVDMLYQLLQLKEKNRLHSSLILLTIILFWAWLSGNVALISLSTFIKAILYLYRKISYYKLGYSWFPMLSIIRILALLVPLILLIVQLEFPLWGIYLVLLIGEIIDRSEFYHEAEVITPQQKLDELFYSKNRNE